MAAADSGAAQNDPHQPIAAFLDWQRQAAPGEAESATAAILATGDLEGRPSARVVLVKQVDERGFVFFTNYESRKGRDLDANPAAALCFYWPSLSRQVRVEGAVEPLSEQESDAYFASRPRGSQIGAWASRQSFPVPSREALEERVAHVERRFRGQPVPRPQFWGGFRLAPRRIEFWQGRESRLHDRLCYERQGGAWREERLYP